MDQQIDIPKNIIVVFSARKKICQDPVFPMIPAGMPAERNSIMRGTESIQGFLMCLRENRMCPYKYRNLLTPPES